MTRKIGVLGFSTGLLEVPDCKEFKQADVNAFDMVFCGCGCDYLIPSVCKCFSWRLQSVIRTSMIPTSHCIKIKE